MHEALSSIRIHTPKYKIIGQLDALGGVTTVENHKGQHFRTMGKADGLGKQHLLPEEALYLMERGNLDIRWPQGIHYPWQGLSLSLQSAYTALLDVLGLTLERYTVYTGLRRSGYIVQRSSTWYPTNNDYNGSKPPSMTHEQSLSIFQRLYKTLRYRETERTALGPLVSLGLYRNYGISLVSIPVLHVNNMV